MTTPYAEPTGSVVADTLTGSATAFVATRDATLIEALSRLAASVGARLDVWPDRPTREAWTSAPLVLVGPDAAEELRGVMPRRAGVVVVALQQLVDRDPSIWDGALGVGAERVALLPHSQEWLVDALVESLEGSRRCRVVATVGGCGGAGASILAVAVAVAAAVRGQQALLADLDPLGGGLDLLLGAEDIPGLRWPDLSRTRGRVSGGMLREALPRIDGLSLLSWDRGQLASVPPEAAASVAAGAVRGFDLVVADLPRGGGGVASAWLRLVDLVLLVVPPDVRAVAAASRVVADLDRTVQDVRAVVCGPTVRSMPAELVADSIGLPLFAELRPEPGLLALMARAEPPGLRQRGPLARCAARVLDAVERLGRAA